jgi:hypothetical protein
VDPDFQQVAATALAWMHSHGYADASLTEDAGHGAYDIEAAKAIAEVTVEAPPSRPNVQRLDTVSRNAERPALYFSLRGFTTSAVEWANNVNIALFTMDKDDGAFLPSNPAAEELDVEPPAARAAPAGCRHPGRGQRPRGAGRGEAARRRRRGDPRPHLGGARSQEDAPQPLRLTRLPPSRTAHPANRRFLRTLQGALSRKKPRLANRRFLRTPQGALSRKNAGSHASRVPARPMCGRGGRI